MSLNGCRVSEGWAGAQPTERATRRHPVCLDSGPDLGGQSERLVGGVCGGMGKILRLAASV